MSGAALTKQNFVNAATKIPHFIENIKEAMQKDKEQRAVQAEFRKQIEERAAGLQMFDNYETALAALQEQSFKFDNGRPVPDVTDVAYKENGEVHILHVEFINREELNSWDRHYSIDIVMQNNK